MLGFIGFALIVAQIVTLMLAATGNMQWTMWVFSPAIAFAGIWLFLFCCALVNAVVPEKQHIRSWIEDDE